MHPTRFWWLNGGQVSAPHALPQLRGADAAASRAANAAGEARHAEVQRGDPEGMGMDRMNQGVTCTYIYIHTYIPVGGDPGT